ncbi:MAG: zinc ribbon domain-containing protein [Chloroflexi bacterium]|nr:MAG: zinc ribbon domain-containing protein [Chloroflexota bacterium]HDN78851.1 zinc ribbon domain-containing protein [Chloroflexota bacterium]
MPIEIPADIVARILLVLQIILALVGAFFIAFWLSLVIWTFRDIRSRTRDALAQILATLMVLLFNIPGLLLYFILRPQETLAEAYERALEEEALLQGIEEREVCPGCGRKVEQDFLVCPYCHTKLKKTCLMCKRLLHLNWNICPYCGAPQVSSSTEVKAEAESGAQETPPEAEE